MKPAVWCFGFLACFGIAGAWAAPGRGAPPQDVTVLVVNAHLDPVQPVQRVRVSLMFLDGGTLITGVTDVTNSKGEALLQVSLEAAQRGGLRIDIDGANGLVVYQPADGQLDGLPPTLSIRLLPKGSPALLGPAQIEAMLHRLSLENKHLAQENREVKSALAAAETQKPDDLAAAMAEWAKANGFPAEDANKQVQQWAEQVQQRKDQATAEQQALAELALKHYGVAAQLSNKAADDVAQSMDEDEKRFLEDRRKKLHQFVDMKFQSANAYQLNLQYHQATQVLEQARDRAAAEYKHYPDDAALRGIWLEALRRAADARVVEGVNGAAGESSPLLTQSIEDYRGLLRSYSMPEDRAESAATNNNLGIVLADQGVRSSGAQATELFSQAVEAYRAALEVYTKKDLPQDWAMTQVNLGTALGDRGERSSGAQATDLLAQAVQAYQAALEVYTKVDLPQDWAMTQNDLGVALRIQGERSGGAQGAKLLAQAVEAYRAALQVRSKADQPQDWASTENNLGNALTEQGERSYGAQGAELLAQAVQALRAALEVYTKAGQPQLWALTQNNLGVTLTDQGERSSGTQAADLFAQAVQALQAALEVRTKAELPQDWAATENNLAGALTDQGEQSSGTQATDLLAQAVQAYRATLDVYTRADLPKYAMASEKRADRPTTDAVIVPEGLSLPAFAGRPNPAGLEAHNLPLASRISHINAGIAKTAVEIALNVRPFHICQRGDHRGRSVEAHLAIGDVELRDTRAAGAEVGERLFLCLESTGGSNGHVVVGQQGVHRRGVSLQDGIAPDLFKLVDLMAALVLLRSGNSGMERVHPHRKHKHGS